MLGSILKQAFDSRQGILVFEISDNSFPKWLWWIAIPVNIISTFFNHATRSTDELETNYIYLFHSGVALLYCLGWCSIQCPYLYPKRSGCSSDRGWTLWTTNGRKVHSKAGVEINYISWATPKIKLPDLNRQLRGKFLHNCPWAWIWFKTLTILLKINPLK